MNVIYILYREIYPWYHLVMTNIAMENHGKSPFLISKPSISMGHLYHGYVSHDQRVQAFLFFHMRTW